MQKARYLVAAAVLALAASVQATPTLMIQSGTNTVTIADNGLGDQNPAIHTVEFIGTVGDWNISFATGVESGSVGQPTLTLSSNLSSTEASTITLWFSDTGFGPTPSLTSWSGHIDGTFGGCTTGSTVDYYKYYDTGNTLFGTGTLLTHRGTFTASPGSDSFSGSQGGIFISGLASGYSLTEEVVIHNVAAESETFTATDVIVPEPSTFAMLFLGLAGLGTVVRRKQAA